MICTGTFLAMGEIPIIFFGLLIGQYLGTQYGFWVALISSLVITWTGLAIFHAWYWGRWPFIRKVNRS